jgi:hypothetical protein
VDLALGTAGNSDLAKGKARPRVDFWLLFHRTSVSWVGSFPGHPRAASAGQGSLGTARGRLALTLASSWGKAGREGTDPVRGGACGKPEEHEAPGEDALDPASAVPHPRNRSRYVRPRKIFAISNTYISAEPIRLNLSPSGVRVVRSDKAPPSPVVTQSVVPTP